MRLRIILLLGSVVAWGVAPGALAATSGAVDIAPSSGLWDGVPSFWFGSDPVDVDDDGDMDVLLNPHHGLTQDARVMLNDGSGHFSAGFVFPDRDRHGCDWADVDDDGLVDLYCAIGALTGTGFKSNELWIQQGDGSFVDKAAQFGVSDPIGRARNAAFLDANSDGRPDLYVRNDHPRKDGLPTPSRLLLNVDGTHFVSARKMGVDLELSAAYATSACIQIVDIEGDEDDDILTCDYNALYLFRNRGGVRFVNKAADLGIAPGRWMDAELVDVDLDGRMDLVGARPGGVFIQSGGKGGTFGKLRRLAAGNAFRWVASGDINGDDYLDLYAVAVDPTKDQSGEDAPDKLFINDGTGALKVVDSPQADPAGSGSSVDAIDVDGDGSAEFLVTSGHGTVSRGQLQLIDWI